MKNHKISFCIVSMNRTHHVQQTLLKNLCDNADYESLEFILLDYNSTDGLEDYIKNDFQEYIAKGKLTYFKTLTPSYFHRSHSRNLSFKLAQGDILCNVDADNFTGKGFASYINRVFNENGKIFMTVIRPYKRKNIGFKSDTAGRICFPSKTFKEVTGYDEKIRDYGFEDFDLANRLELHGLSRYIIRSPKFIDAISHEQSTRISNEFGFSCLSNVLISYVTFGCSELILLYEDYSFTKCSLYTNTVGTTDVTDISEIGIHDYSNFCGISTNSLAQGKWQRGNKDITLFYELNLPSPYVLTFLDNGIYRDPGNVIYNEFTKENTLESIAFIFSQIYNKMIMNENSQTKTTAVNTGGYGKGIVYKNFDYTNPIIVL